MDGNNGFYDTHRFICMVPEKSAQGRPSIGRREVVATAGASIATGLAGCGYIGDTSADDRPLAGESITVGVLATFDSDTGTAVRRGTELAVEHVNGSGGIGGAAIDVVEADTSGEDGPEKAASEHDRLCREAGCDLTVGLQIGSTVLDVLPSIADHETVHLTPGVFDVRVGEAVADNYDEYRYHFRAGLPDMEGMADALGEFVGARHDELGWESAAILSDPVGFDPYHERVVERVSDHLDVPMERQPPGLTTTSTDLLDDIEDEGCDVLLYGGYLDGDNLVTVWASHEPAFALGGFDVVNGTEPGLWAETDGAVESTFTVDALTPESANTPHTGAFVTEYESTYAEHPMYSGALAYDALHLYREAVEAILDDGDSEFPEQDEIVDALEDVTFTDGVVYPEFTFTGPDAERVHDPVWDSMADSGMPVVQQWQSGAGGEGVREAIAPARNQTARYQAPPWMRD